MNIKVDSGSHSTTPQLMDSLKDPNHLIEVHIHTNDHITQFTNFLIATIDLPFMLKAAVLWQVGLFITKFIENLNTTNDNKFNILHEQSLFC